MNVFNVNCLYICIYCCKFIAMMWAQRQVMPTPIFHVTLRYNLFKFIMITIFKLYLSFGLQMRKTPSFESGARQGLCSVAW
jgi:hypothetical protein